MVTAAEARQELARRELEFRERQQGGGAPTGTSALALANPLLGVGDVVNRAIDRASVDDNRWMQRLGAAGSGFRDAVSFGFYDELQGVDEAIGAMLRGANRDQQRDAYNSGADRVRENLDRSMERHPLSTAGGMLAGSFVPGAGVGGGVARGASFAGRMARSAVTGAGAGALYGAGSGVDPESRLSNAAMGGAFGGALGAGFHGAAEAAGGVPRFIERTARLPEGSVGNALSAPFRALGVKARGQGYARQAVDDVLATARNAGYETPDALFAALQHAAPESTLAEALGNSGTSRLAALARLRGETGNLVEDYVTQRNRNQLGALEDTFVRGASTGDELEQAVRRAWRTEGRQLYGPILDAPMDQRSRAALDRLQQTGLWRHRAVQSAWNRAGQMVDDAIDAGDLPAEAARNIRHRLHYTKVALSQMVDDPRTLEPGLANIENANLQSVARQFTDSLESIIPGYDAARGRLADLGQARRAIEAGRAMFGARFPNHGSLQRFVDGLSEGERAYWRAGVEEAIQNRLVRGARDGRRNVANVALGEDFVRRLRAALGPEEADPMIARARELAALFESGNRMRPTIGSITSNVAAEVGDLASAPPPRPTISNALDSVWRYGWGETIGKSGEPYRNMLGRLYATPVRDARQRYTGLLSRASREERRREARRRLALTQSAYYSGLGSAGVVSSGGEQ